MMPAPGVADRLNLIDFFNTQLMLYYFISTVKKCLHPLEPSFVPIKKSPKMGIVDQCTTITLCNLFYNFIIF